MFIRNDFGGKNQEKRLKWRKHKAKRRRELRANSGAKMGWTEGFNRLVERPPLENNSFPEDRVRYTLFITHPYPKSIRGYKVTFWSSAIPANRIKFYYTPSRGGFIFKQFALCLGRIPRSLALSLPFRSKFPSAPISPYPFSASTPRWKSYRVSYFSDRQPSRGYFL